MRIKNLTKCYIYYSETITNYGEKTKKWYYKDNLYLNIQQDFSELDKNSAGIIDYDRLKIRTDYPINLNKYDGISFEKLQVNEDNSTVIPPKYVVISNPKIGKSTTYTCEIYHGE